MEVDDGDVDLDGRQTGVLAEIAEHRRAHLPGHLGDGSPVADGDVEVDDAAQTFGAGLVRAVCIGLALLGLLLLVAALRRGKPGALPLPSRHDGVQVTASRRQVQQTLSTAARRVDGVDSARVKAGRRKVRVKATTPLRDPGDLGQRVTAAVTERLDELELTDRVRPRVSLSSKGTR